MNTKVGFGCERDQPVAFCVGVGGVRRDRL